MTEQPPSAEAMKIADKVYTWGLRRGAEEIDALVARYVSAETVRWQNRDRQRLEQIGRLQETVQGFQSARDERPATDPLEQARQSGFERGIAAAAEYVAARPNEQPAVLAGLMRDLGSMYAAERPAPETVHLTPREQAVMTRALLRSTRPVPEASFAADLAAAQEPLGEEFEKVLHDNLDQLYVRSERPAPPPAQTQWFVDPPRGTKASRVFGDLEDASRYANECPPHTRIVERPAPECEHHWIGGNDGSWCTKCKVERPAPKGPQQGAAVVDYTERARELLSGCVRNNPFQGRRS